MRKKLRMKFLTTLIFQNIYWLVTIYFVLSSILYIVEGASQCKEFGIQSRRFAFKNGFHRELQTVIEWNGLDGCKVLMEETLPCGMYVDVDQLETVDKHWVLKVLSKEKTNVEWPAHKAESQHLLVYPSNLPSKLRENHYQLSVRVPIHLRYHQPVPGKTFETISLQPPNILINCSENRIPERCKGRVIKAPCDGTEQETCEWINMTNEEVSKEFLEFQVPIGTMNHRSTVTIATALSAIGGTVWTIIVVMKSPN